MAKFLSILNIASVPKPKLLDRKQPTLRKLQHEHARGFLPASNQTLESIIPIIPIIPQDLIVLQQTFSAHFQL